MELKRMTPFLKKIILLKLALFTLFVTAGELLTGTAISLDRAITATITSSSNND
jgi:hypothetical protein